MKALDPTSFCLSCAICEQRHPCHQRGFSHLIAISDAPANCFLVCAKKESFFFRLRSAILVPRLRHSPMYRARNRGWGPRTLCIWPTLLLPSRPLAQPICFSTANNRLRIYLPTSLKTLKSPYLEGNQTGLPSRKKTRKKISGDILNPRDNSVAAAYKFATAALLFELNTHKRATFSDLYLIHQQGTRGAEEHVNHPDRIAWKSMCATDEGREKGEKWCKRAIWANTLPEIKHIWKSVDNLTSSAFVTMWQERVHRFYSRYSEATAN